VKNAARVRNATWETFPDGGLCCVFSGQDSAGLDVSVAVPAASLRLMHSEARRRMAADKSRGDRASPLPGAWHPVNFLLVQATLVGSSDDHRVALILDQHTDVEHSLSFSPADALEIGRRMVAEAEQLLSRPKPTTN
jgi:hypothetical protein